MSRPRNQVNSARISAPLNHFDNFVHKLIEPGDIATNNKVVNPAALAPREKVVIQQSSSNQPAIRRKMSNMGGLQSPTPLHIQNRLIEQPLRRKSTIQIQHQEQYRQFQPPKPVSQQTRPGTIATIQLRKPPVTQKPLRGKGDNEGKRMSFEREEMHRDYDDDSNCGDDDGNSDIGDNDNDHHMDNVEGDNDNNGDADDDDDADNGDKDGDVRLNPSEGRSRYKRIFQKRKKASVRAKEKRIRQNRQLRKVITPKNALMALNEIKGIKMSEFVIINNSNAAGFDAILQVNEKEYVGRGISKITAKNNACEQALRDYFIDKIIKSPKSKRQKMSNSDGTDSANNANNASTTTAMELGNDGDEDSNSRSGGMNDVPMLNLASYAIYKLYSEWENEGFEIPDLHPPVYHTVPNAQQEKEVKSLPIRQELPSNWHVMHPTTLLCVMRPGLSYVDYANPSLNMNATQTVCVKIEGTEYIGTGRSKKIARRNAAINACNTLFGTSFVAD